MLEFFWVLLGIMVVSTLLIAVGKIMHEFAVQEGHVGLLYRHGRYLRTLQPGQHKLFGRGYTVNHLDMRRQSTVVPGQELLTADHLSVKVSLVLQYQIVDAALAQHGTSTYQGELHLLAQLALRNTVSSRDMEGLLAARNDLGGELLAALAPHTGDLGLQVLSADIRDIMLPGEIRRANADVIKARKEGQAALERARGETAALRSLANAARMVDNNPGLLNLRILQTLSGANGGNTVVLNVPNGVVPLKQGNPGKPKMEGEEFGEL